jgi:hypothetical protein
MNGGWIADKLAGGSVGKDVRGTTQLELCLSSDEGKAGWLGPRLESGKGEVSRLRTLLGLHKGELKGVEFEIASRSREFR